MQLHRWRFSILIQHQIVPDESMSGLWDLLGGVAGKSHQFDFLASDDFSVLNAVRFESPNHFFQVTDGVSRRAIVHKYS